MDTSTGLIAVIVDDGRVTANQLAASVAFARSAPEIVRAVVASPRPDEVTAAVSPAHPLAAVAAEIAVPPPLGLLKRVAEWSECLDGEPVRMVAVLDPRRPIDDPWVVYECLQRLITNGFADGIVGVKKTGNGQRWAPAGEWLGPAADGPYVEDPSLYVFRRALIDELPADWRAAGRYLPYEILPIHR